MSARPGSYHAPMTTFDMAPWSLTSRPRLPPQPRARAASRGADRPARRPEQPDLQPLYRTGPNRHPEHVRAHADGGVTVGSRVRHGIERPSESSHGRFVLRREPSAGEALSFWHGD